jgi:hypothetical protein
MIKDHNWSEVDKLAACHEESKKDKSAGQEELKKGIHVCQDQLASCQTN